MPAKTLATRLVLHSFTVPAGTVLAVPHTEDVVLDEVLLQVVQIVIPPGHNGQTGMQLRFSGDVIVPWSDGNDWLIGNGENPAFPVELQVSTVTLAGYNTGIFDHTFYVRFTVMDLELGAVSAPPRVQLIAL